MAVFRISKTSINVCVGHDLFRLKLPLMSQMDSEEGIAYANDMINYFQTESRCRWGFSDEEILELKECLAIAATRPAPQPRIHRAARVPRILPEAECIDCQETFGLAFNASDRTRCPECRIEKLKIRDSAKAADLRASKARAGG
jgi:hypothetical protein